MGGGGGSREDSINRSLGNDGSSIFRIAVLDYFPFPSVKRMGGKKNKNRQGSFLFSTLSSPLFTARTRKKKKNGREN